MTASARPYSAHRSIRPSRGYANGDQTMRETNGNLASKNLSFLEDRELRLEGQLRDIWRRYAEEATPVTDELTQVRAALKRRREAEWQHRRGRQPVERGDVAVPVAEAEAAPEPVPNAQAKAQAEARACREGQLVRLAASTRSIEEGA